MSQLTSTIFLMILPKICVMHPPSASRLPHVCSGQCKNYPEQTCGNVCGIVTVVGAVIAACDDDLYEYITGPMSYFFLQPTKYELYLRRILISWFIKEEITLLGLNQAFTLSHKVVREILTDPYESEVGGSVDPWSHR
ncbi:hypothetical protein EGW08_020849 [Elysia chlorotica]|uniref:Uncharacterized protein n=1 Tax=Elysia chlorotica TaxID=188477 RepID=A0A3S1AZV3_ELYCH|nr:hypothetical protein EGW08_020849 [Elysia chlorotica]